MLSLLSQQMVELMSFDHVAMEYYPTVWFNEFWLLRDYLIPMNETVTEVPLTFTLTSISLTKFSLMSQMDQAFSKQVSQHAVAAVLPQAAAVRAKLGMH